MSHNKIIFSPEGTPLLKRSVGELVAERPSRSRIFQSHQIDFCCQGGVTLQDACAKKNISPEILLKELENEAETNSNDAFNPATLTPPEMIRYIVDTHHSFLKKELPRIHIMAEKVAKVHGGGNPSLIEIFEVFSGMENELMDHLMKEEQILFPAIISLYNGSGSPMPISAPISRMMYEHEDAGSALKKMHELSHGYQPPSDACNTYRALFSGLKDLEDDLHRHIHLENSVLFPLAQSMGEK